MVAAMAMSALPDVQRCAMCCSCVSAPECSHLLSVPAGGLTLLPNLISLRKSSETRQLLTRAVTRSLHSSLTVSEGFGSSQRPFADEQCTTKPALRTLNGSGVSPPQQQEQAGVREAKPEEGTLNSQGPEGTGAHAETLADGGCDVDMKRSARARPPSMSFSQGFSPLGSRSVSHTISLGPAGHPLSTARLPGTMGFVMAFSVAALGLKTAVEKQVFLTGSPQKVCAKCEGYGVQQCHVCQGRGVLTWEGKLRHTDPCPLCFGSCLRKCQNCGGAKLKKGRPPGMVSQFHLNAGRNKK